MLYLLHSEEWREMDRAIRLCDVQECVDLCGPTRPCHGYGKGHWFSFYFLNSHAGIVHTSIVIRFGTLRSYTSV
jgi:hypothetical protein